MPVSSMHTRIRQARRIASLTQAQLAERLGVATSAVGQWEQPRGTHPKLVHLAALATTTGVSLAWLALGAGPPRLAGEERPTLSPSCVAVDALEERLLALARRIPPRRREALEVLLEHLSE